MPRTLRPARPASGRRRSPRSLVAATGATLALTLSLSVGLGQGGPAAAAGSTGSATGSDTGTATTTGSTSAAGADALPTEVPVDTAQSVIDVVNKLLGGALQDIVGQAVYEITSKISQGGRDFWLTNHLDLTRIPAEVLSKLGLGQLLPGLPLGGLLTGHDAGGTVPDDGIRREYLVVWAGDNNILDKSGSQLLDLPNQIGPNLIGAKDLIGPDFFAVVDATKGSPSYGKVVNTATVGPLVENEPHHMQYIWHKGNVIYAGGLFTDVTYVIDTSKLPQLKLKAINLPTDTLCGSVPDAYWVTKDGDAFGTYMGGPDVPGPCTYSDGSVRFGNGFAGSPGELVRLDSSGRTVYEAPATPVGGEYEQRCDNIPALQFPTCANPHGVQAREDLGILVSSDYNEPRNIILNPIQAPSSYLRRPTVRTWDISDPDKPKLRAVSFLPDGPRQASVPHREEPRAAMETTVTNLPQHKGAFASTMQGGAIFYTPDITVAKPEWREVFDLTLSNRKLDPNSSDGGGSNGAWVQTSLDDKYLYHAVSGRKATATAPGAPPYILVLDIRKLLASGESPECSIDTIDEVTAGGAESDCQIGRAHV